MAEPRSEFRNESAGFIGVVVMEEGKPRGISVEPGDSVFLTEEEQIATANAPRDDKDNPFVNGALKLLTPATEIANRRPIGDTLAPQVPQSERQQEEAQAEREKTEEAQRQQVEAEARRKAAAQKQAQQPATPVEETGAAISPGGAPTHGKRAASEEVATPEAPAKA